MSRAWFEPRVRFWWLLAVLLLLATAYLAAAELSLRSREWRLIQDGVRVEAIVRRVGNMELKGHSFPPDSETALQFEYEGQLHRVIGRLAGRTSFIEVGQTVTLHIAPEDPTLWTARTEPEPLRETLLGSMLVLPSVLIAALIAWTVRRRLLRLWVAGTAVRATVLESRPSPLSPSRGVVHCTSAGVSDERVFTVYSRRPVERGDALWIVVDSNHRAAAADWFSPL